MTNQPKNEEYRRGPGNHLKVQRSRATKNVPIVNEMVSQPPSNTDPLGMYTGIPLDELEIPVQDADDL